jgi:uridine kinase
MPEIRPVVGRILTNRPSISTNESMLVAVSGIDASGKGYCTKLIVDALREQGLNAVGIGLDPWYNLPGIRFGQDRPGEHFYWHGFRFDELFEQLILPLKRTRTVAINARHVEEHATDYHAFRYEFHQVDVIVLEGIFLFQPAFRSHYDLAVWVECSFETALERAIVRGQEGLPPDETVRAFESIYFPAERFHFEQDDPKASADMILVNDPRLDPSGA